jgi:hypothetical protein
VDKVQVCAYGGGRENNCTFSHFGEGNCTILPILGKEIAPEEFFLKLWLQIITSRKQRECAYLLQKNILSSTKMPF